MDDSLRRGVDPSLPGLNAAVLKILAGWTVVAGT